MHEASGNYLREETLSPMDLGNPEASSLLMADLRQGALGRYSPVHDGFCTGTLSTSPPHGEELALLVDSPALEEILMSPFNHSSPHKTGPHILDDGIVDVARAFLPPLRSKAVFSPAVKSSPSARSVHGDQYNFISPASVLASFVHSSPGTICKEAENEGTVMPYDLVFPSPPLYAHAGVDINEFEYRTRRYKLRHPGKEVDKGWLASYAGRLSENGEVLDGYRCFITGCNHTNRRRDHILVHVGAHVNIRPYSCDFCGQCFLRKNERKRHEVAHQKLRSHECHVCKKTFVRQDLVKRHLRQQHGTVEDSTGSRSRKTHRVKREEHLLSTI
ncbi:hypothetical protein CONPUDRAFT_84837 [Coniophora puteana RWD-64-598 SS2]|uniref:C2H2-type domain-containing protein n=1 Tax=Coniophora puteana (strain RWD-64-598) TaxID=741705 RepID=A0A5M3MB00_CONPW|nr:uncharacterized protein CONPUDRAFT_84837 [Coniophora puteana RWD-64-598 SS2]EIW76166.1 hypothetical protein CONPUDRAFT_84837 [Coniophora puteana RWD-64-598 SS2]